VGHHKAVPYRLLKCDREFSAGEAGEGNLLVEGDNLHALKALLPYYGGKVKCIYIDPPYNTGNEGWIYNDNVNAPEIHKWLGQVVGKEAEDLSRHDKWLCMMYPRLVLLRQFLREDGAIFISIDDNEFAHLREVTNEIFGAQNFVATVIWQKIFSTKNTARHLSESHDFILVYAKDANQWKPNLVPRTAKQDVRYKNPDNDPRGPWTSGDLSARNFYGAGTYPITCPSGRVIAGPPKGMYWRVSKENFIEMDKDKRIWWGKGGGNVPRLKRFLSEVKEGVVTDTLWLHTEVGHTQEAKKEIVSLLPEGGEVFITPKPTRLLRRILQLSTDKDSIVMDSFAGSGTTGHAVWLQNKDDGGKRRFIMVEVEQKISTAITAARLKSVINGYGDLPGLGGGFRYCTLAEPLFDERGQINSAVKFADLAHHVFFTETGEPASKRPDKRTPLLGIHNGRAIYLLFNGILGDKQPQGGNVLTNDVLKILPPHAGPRVIYGTACRLSANRLAREAITFRQIPYEIKTD